MIILGIETSCDETAVAIVNERREILANHVLSQLKDHEIYGGVVPEIAARRHLDHLDALMKASLQDADLTLNEIDGIACTAGPGLIGGVMVGVTYGKAVACAAKKPFLAINHLAAHALTVRLTHDLEFPYLLLLVSGGHTQLIIVYDSDKFDVLGSTIDDAVGECFDKTAKLLDLPYPGGPRIEKYAKQGNPKAFNLPKPLLHHSDPDYRCRFSFSGLKTAVRHLIESHGEKKEDSGFIADVSACFQETVSLILADRVSNALKACSQKKIPLTAFVVAGGVASNMALRETLEKVAKAANLDFVAPPLTLCTDNGAMVAWAGLEQLRKGHTDPLNFAPRPRWPLNEIRKT